MKTASTLRAYSTSLVLTLALTAATLTGTALPSTGWAADTYNARNERQFQDWNGRELLLGEDRFFRASVEEDESTDLFVYDQQPGECDHYQLRLIGSLETTPDADTLLPGLPMRLRIDDQPIHATTAEFSADRGDPTGFIALDGLADGPRFFNELRLGQTLRIELTFPGGEPTYFRFSLAGSFAAITHVEALCEAAGAVKGKPKGDADFFNAPAPAAVQPGQAGREGFI